MGRVILSPDQVPDVREPLPVLKLGSPWLLKDAFVKRIVRTVAPRGRRKKSTSGFVCTYEGKRLAAFTHAASGASHVFPSLEQLKPGSALADRAASVAATFADEGSFFPRDDTSVTPLAPTVLVGSQRDRSGKRVRTAEYLAYVRFQRRVNDIPVFGRGHRATIAVAADGSIHGLAHRWRPATTTRRAIAPRSREQVAKAISTQLAASAGGADVNVDDVSLAYYDGGGNFLQPVFRYEASIPFPEAEGQHPAARRLFGYVSIGSAPEPLPKLGARPGRAPKVPKGANPPAAPPPGDPTVGRYVVRSDSSDWVASANAFLAGLRGTFLGFHFSLPIPFTDSQYYWAYPYLFESDKNRFVNSVQIALNEVHGNWWWFSTRDNNDDGVNLSSIPSTGYGAGSGGSLCYWIIHSCEVIPTQTDESTSFDIWWNIFNGLHAVIGYRTDMWINDGVTGPFGFFVGLGAALVPAWLNEVASNDSYDDGDTYHDGNRNMDEPMGRASAVAVCGHSDDTANDLAPLGRPGCLTEWWFDN